MPLQLPPIFQEKPTHSCLVFELKHMVSWFHGLMKVRRKDLFSIWGALKIFKQVNEMITFMFYCYPGDSINNKLEEVKTEDRPARMIL